MIMKRTILVSALIALFSTAALALTTTAEDCGKSIQGRGQSATAGDIVKFNTAMGDALKAGDLEQTLSAKDSVVVVPKCTRTTVTHADGTTQTTLDAQLRIIQRKGKFGDFVTGPQTIEIHGDSDQATVSKNVKDVLNQLVQQLPSNS